MDLNYFDAKDIHNAVLKMAEESEKRTKIEERKAAALEKIAALAGSCADPT